MEAIADIIFSFFELCRLTPLEIRPDLFQVEIDDQLAKELDGWRARGRLFQFTFDKELAEKYGAELISHGSYRLDSILQVIQKQAILARGYLPHTVFYERTIRQKIIDRLSLKNPMDRWYVIDHKNKYGPFLWFTLRLTYLAYEKREQIRKVLVDLVSGEVINYEIPADLLKTGYPNTQNIYRRKLSYKKAYQCLQDEITSQLEHQDPKWAIKATQQFDEEYRQLESYFEDMPDSKHRTNRLNELMSRAKPRIQVRPLRGAILYLPKLEYKIVQVSGDKEKTNQIIYDPVSNQYQFV